MSKQHRTFSGNWFGGIFMAAILVLTANAPLASGAVTLAVGFQGMTPPPNSFSGITAWSSIPTVDTTTLAASPGAFASVPESNLGFDDFDPATTFDFSFAQSFLATTSGKLTKVQFPFTGSVDPDVTFQMNVYDGLTGDWSNISFFDDPDVMGTADPFIPGTHVSNNLLTDASPLTLTGYTQMGATAAVLDFSLTGADQVTIVSGKTYIVEFVLTEAPVASNFLLGRNGANGDNSTDYVDGQAFRAREPLNGNSLRDFAMAFTIAPPATLGADFDGVNGVNAADLAIWRSGYGTGTTQAQGDADLDGDVDGDDVLVWQRQFGLTGATPAASAVPEPAATALVLYAIGACVSLRRRKV